MHFGSVTHTLAAVSHLFQKTICLASFLLTNAVLLFFKFSSVEIFRHVHKGFCPERVSDEFNMSPSQRLRLTILHTKHLFRGQRKACCLSTGLVEGGRVGGGAGGGADVTISTLFMGLIEVSCLLPFFSWRFHL